MTSIELDRTSTASASSGHLSTADLAELARPNAPSHLIRWRERNLIVGGVLITLIVLIALFAPIIAPHGEQDTDYTARLHPPSREHLFGTDNLGRDIFSRVLYGARIDLQVGLISVLFPFLIGGTLGCLAGYYGGRIDNLVMRMTD